MSEQEKRESEQRHGLRERSERVGCIVLGSFYALCAGAFFAALGVAWTRAEVVAYFLVVAIVGALFGAGVWALLVWAGSRRRKMDKPPNIKSKVKRLILYGIIFLVVILILAAIAIPNFLRGNCRAEQSEAKQNLTNILSKQQKYFSKTRRYADTFEKLEWRPREPTFRYAIFLLSKEVIQPDGEPIWVKDKDQ
jgi:NADH:ubiquinone oxidoreductase subunit 6 (subunit J)